MDLYPGQQNDSVHRIFAIKKTKKQKKRLGNFEGDVPKGFFRRNEMMLARMTERSCIISIYLASELVFGHAWRVKEKTRGEYQS